MELHFGSQSDLERHTSHVHREQYDTHSEDHHRPSKSLFHRQRNMICLNDCYLFAESTRLEVQTKFHSTDIDSTLRSGMKHPTANAPQPKAKRRKHQESSGRTLPTTPIDSRHSVEHATINSPAGSSTPQLASTTNAQKQQPNRKVLPPKPVSLIPNYDIYT
jgi:hypothetical protein